MKYDQSGYVEVDNLAKVIATNETGQIQGIIRPAPWKECRILMLFDEEKSSQRYRWFDFGEIQEWL